MFSTKLTWTDLDGNEQESVLSFHLYESEITELKLTEDIWDPEYLEDLKNRMIEERKKEKPSKLVFKELIHLIKEYIRASYGVKSENGKSFYKNKAKTEEFMNSEAFSQFFLKIMGDPDMQMRFIESVAATTNEQQMAIRQQVQEVLKDGE